MARSGNADVLVLGAGVSGLSVALLLTRDNVRVRIVAAHKPGATTSATAAAICSPYMVSDPRVAGWYDGSMKEFTQIAAEPGSGVRLVRGVEAATSRIVTPDWAARFADCETLPPSDLPPGYLSGWTYTAPVVDMPRYLDFLETTLSMQGVHLEILDRPVSSFGEIRDTSRVVVNCTGLGSRDLVPDDDLVGVLGQLVVLDNPGIEKFFMDYPESEQPTYIIPHDDHVVLGGSVLADDRNTDLDERSARAIIRRCAVVDSRLADAAVRGHRFGLRPCRSSVRLQLAEENGVTVVHNYGHGGGGVMLSWGCAQEVRDIVTGELGG